MAIPVIHLVPEAGPRAKEFPVSSSLTFSAMNYLAQTVNLKFALYSWFTPGSGDRRNSARAELRGVPRPRPHLASWLRPFVCALTESKWRDTSPMLRVGWQRGVHE